jgi:hypothetical protein
VPPSATFDASGGSGSVLVIVAGGACTWTAVSNANWITLTSGASGVGNGLFQFTIAGNPGASRSGTLTVAGMSYLVTQSGQ